jgi:hypothetical protein
MKKFATIFMAIMLVAGVSYTVKAQIGIGANAGLAMPMGSFGDAYNMRKCIRTVHFKRPNDYRSEYWILFI